jgi:hypothetical protein
MMLFDLIFEDPLPKVLIENFNFIEEKIYHLHSNKNLLINN